VKKYIERLKALFGRHINLPTKTDEAKKSLSDHAEDAMYREINEELDAQKLTDFVKDNMKLIIAFAAAAVIIVGTWQFMQARNNTRTIESATMYETAVMMMNTGNVMAAREQLLRTADIARGGMRDIALWNTAMIDMQIGNTDEGIGILERLRRRGATRDFRDLATLHIAMHRADDMTARQFESFLSPLQNRRSPFYYTALLVIAQKHIAAGDDQSAQRFISRITMDGNAPVSIRLEAEMLR